MTAAPGAVPLRVAVIGSGPAGIYTADALAKSGRAVEVDVIDLLPTPYGLVRYGVAPDHQKIKSITRTLHEVLETPGVRFLGNTRYGADLTLDDLRAHYPAVVIATGAPHDRRLGIVGEDLPGSVSAPEVVAWYSGRPGSVAPPLHARSVAVIGAGNVALDIARVFAKGSAGLAMTDMPEHVHDAFRSVAVTDVHLVIRRGPADVKFTPLELREMAALPGVGVIVEPADVAIEAAATLPAEAKRPVRTMTELFATWAGAAPTGAPVRVTFHFLRRPVELIGTDHVEAIRLERCVPDGAGGVTGTGETETIPAELVVRSVGYRGAPVADLPFDQATATLPHQTGRVVRSAGVGVAGVELAGVYVAGWIKRGPTGVIGTNKADAAETVRTLLADAESGRLRPVSEERDAVISLLDSRGVDYTLWDGWLRLDAAELEAGRLAGRDRTKLGELEHMLRIARRPRQ
ncbi:MAG: FAD-dependent oxidoreductase [Mycobacteriales bacterium]